MNFSPENLPTDVAALHSAIRKQFGALDNQTSKWYGQLSNLQALFPDIEHALAAHLGKDSWALARFKVAAKQLDDRTTVAAQAGRESLDAELILAAFSLRFYIWLASFLDAFSQALAKKQVDSGVDVDRSMQANTLGPYFFERSHLQPSEAKEIIDSYLQDIEKLGTEPSDLLKVMRIRNGLFSILNEEYAPWHPGIYPLLDGLMGLQIKTLAENKDQVIGMLRQLQEFVSEQTLA